ncbi:MAG: DUF2818 family protein [Pseudomonadota bacterium]
MTTAYAVYSLIVLSFVLANLPWLNQRLFAVIPLHSPKPFWLRLLEWVGALALAALLAWRFELGCASAPAFFGLSGCAGEIYAKTWEFYSVTAVLFAVFALPGFIYFVEGGRRKKSV